MPTSSPDPSLLNDSSPDYAQRNIQPFFVLHKGSPHSNTARKSDPGNKARTRRRRIGYTTQFSPPPPKSYELSEPELAKELHDDVGYHSKVDIFRSVWSKIESTAKEVLRNINADVFNEVGDWVQEAFKQIRSHGMPDPDRAIRTYPIVTDPLSNLIHTGLLFTKNMEFVDDLLTFEDLGLHLKSQGCSVANLSSYNFSAKNGIIGCLRSLLRQFMTVSLDVADLSILAAWYAEQNSSSYPLVVIIDDMEKCCGPVLSDFILMLSEWAVKLPVILIFGVATTVDSLKNILPTNALQHLSPHKFVLVSPTEKMDAIIEAVLVKQCSKFSIGHQVATFLRDYFTRKDGTLTSFIRALKIAVAQHIAAEPLNVSLKHVFKEDIQDSMSATHLPLPEMMIKRAIEFPSFRSPDEPNGELVAHGLSDVKELQKSWSSVVMCLHEVGKCHHIKLLDLFCEALSPDLHHSMTSDCNLKVESSDGKALDNYSVNGQSQIGGIISQVTGKVRHLPAMTLQQVLNSWENYTKNIPEIQNEVRELLSSLGSNDEKGLMQERIDTSKRKKTRFTCNTGKDAETLNQKASALLKCMVRQHMMPIECMPFHEFSCFKDVAKLQSALIGDPRRAVQIDLLEFHKFLKCTCCSKSGPFLSPSMPDTSIMYKLAQEHGDLINLHDWYNSFKATILQPKMKTKSKAKYSPSPKKRKGNIDHPNKSEASIQAGFCRAVTELQITGLLRMPSKRRPDYVQRVAFGL